MEKKRKQQRNGKELNNSPVVAWVPSNLCFSSRILLPFGVEMDREVIAQFWLDQWAPPHPEFLHTPYWSFLVLNEEETSQGLLVDLVLFECVAGPQKALQILPEEFFIIDSLQRRSQAQERELLFAKKNGVGFVLALEKGKACFFSKASLEESIEISQELWGEELIPEEIPLAGRNLSLESSPFHAKLEQVNLAQEEQIIQFQLEQEKRFYLKLVGALLLFFLLLCTGTFGYGWVLERELRALKSEHAEVSELSKQIKNKLRMVEKLSAQNITEYKQRRGAYTPDLLLDHFAGLLADRGDWSQLKVSQEGEFRVRLHFKNWETLEQFEGSLKERGPFKSLEILQKTAKSKGEVSAWLTGAFDVK